MDDLLTRKMEILKEHLPKAIDKLIKANNDIQKLMTKALKDRKINAKVGIGILNRIKAGGQIGTDSSIRMNGDQRLEMVKMWFENAKATMNTISEHVKLVHESYLKSIDEQLQLCRKELEQLDEELKKAEEEDEKRRAELKKRRKELYEKAA